MTFWKRNQTEIGTHSTVQFYVQVRVLWDRVLPYSRGITQRCINILNRVGKNAEIEQWKLPEKKTLTEIFLLSFASFRNVSERDEMTKIWWNCKKNIWWNCWKKKIFLKEGYFLCVGFKIFLQFLLKTIGNILFTFISTGKKLKNLEFSTGKKCDN